MNIEQIADAMTGAAFVIQTQIPDGATGQNIQIHTNTAMQKTRVGQIQIAAQDCGKMQLLLVGDGTEHHSAGDIGRPLIILSARVHQQHSLRL